MTAISTSLAIALPLLLLLAVGSTGAWRLPFFGGGDSDREGWDNSGYGNSRGYDRHIGSSWMNPKSWGRGGRDDYGYSDIYRAGRNMYRHPEEYVPSTIRHGYERIKEHGFVPNIGTLRRGYENIKGGYENIKGGYETVKEGFQMGVDRLKETFDMLKDSFWPMVDMVLDDESLIVYVEVPGYKIGDLKLDVKDNVITIKGERKMPEDLTMTSVNWYLHERSYGTFTRHIELPTNVQLDETKIQAWLNFGVLEIKIPRIGGKVTTMNVPISLADRVKQAVGVGSGKVEVEKKQ